MMRLLRNSLLVLTLIVGGIALLLLIPSPQPETVKPWDIRVMPDGNIKVLGIHLAHTDYKTAQQILGQAGEIGLFQDPDGSQRVEAFFDNTNLSGLSAKVVLNIGVDKHLLDAMLARANAGKLQPSLARRYHLTQQDQNTLLNLPVTAITYAPSVRLQEDMIISRFGEAKEKQKAAPNDDGEIGEIWLYPEKHMTITFDPGRKPVLMFYSGNNGNQP